jgi:hypothetical protein
MTVPTEAGWYWWTPGNVQAVYVPGVPRCLHVYESDGVLMAAVPSSGRFGLAGLEDSYPVEMVARAGEFGPRIPPPARLRAMEEMAQAFPLILLPTFSAESNGNMCAYCHAIKSTTDAVFGGDTWHAPTCCWLRAQKEDGDAS